MSSEEFCPHEWTLSLQKGLEVPRGTCYQSQIRPQQMCVSPAWASQTLELTVRHQPLLFVNSSSQVFSCRSSRCPTVPCSSHSGLSMDGSLGEQTVQSGSSAGRPQRSPEGRLASQLASTGSDAGVRGNCSLWSWGPGAQAAKPPGPEGGWGKPPPCVRPGRPVLPPRRSPACL